GFRPLVVLTPDPVELSRGDGFDSVLEGVEEAIGRGVVVEDGSRVDYVRDRHWFPWKGGEPGRDRTKCWERMPGVVLYRPSVVTAAPLLVLFVGETPTWGLRWRQFDAAIQMVRRYAGHGYAGRVAILGPTYSGTARSLAAGLEHSAASGLKFQIAS